jgi:5-dehydro-2-deoxygluconokinase
MAVGLARLGAHTAIIAALGADKLSDFLDEFLRAEKVDTTHVHRVEGFLPSLALTEVFPPDRFPQVFYRRDPVDIKLDITPQALDAVAGSRMFITNGTALCASPSRESAYRALERAHESGARVVLDADYRAMSWRNADDAGLALRLAIPLVDVLITNETELKLAAGCEEIEQAAAKLRGRVPVLVSKLGDKGTRVFQGGEETFLRPYRVEVVSTIGAGDGFAAGFLYGMLHGMPMTECLHHGNAVAAIVVSRLSCSEAMPYLHEVEALIKQQRSQIN